MLNDQHELGNCPELTTGLIRNVDNQHRMVVAADRQIVRSSDRQ